MPVARSLSALAVICIAQIPTVVAAQDRASDSLRIAQTFIGVCGQNVGRYEGTIAQIKALGGKPVPKEKEALVAPQDPNAESEGFFLEEGGLRYLIGVSRALLKGKTMATCAVAADHVEVEEIISITKDILHLGSPSVDDIEMGQRLRIWELSDIGGGAAILVTDGMPSKINALTLALMAPATQ